MITVAGVSHIYRTRGGSVEALRHVDLTVRQGEFVAVVGRSGCGKSTLLRIIAGLIQPTAGNVVVDGAPVAGPRRDVALMLQRPALLPWRSVLNNVLLPMEMFGLRSEEYRERARWLLDLMGLAGFEKRLPHELSRGMKQRVALCRALIQSPRVLLMDEPFSTLDALTREDLAVELQRVQMELRTTIVFVTHSIAEAVLLADRVVVLGSRPGYVRKVIEVDIPRPRSLDTAQYIDERAHIEAETRSQVEWAA